MLCKRGTACVWDSSTGGSELLFVSDPIRHLNFNPKKKKAIKEDSFVLVYVEVLHCPQRTSGDYGVGVKQKM